MAIVAVVATVVSDQIAILKYSLDIEDDSSQLWVDPNVLDLSSLEYRPQSVDSSAKKKI